MKRIYARVASIGTVVLAVGAVSAPAALAHEERTVGKYHFAVGWGQEPAYAGSLNSVQLFLHDKNDKPVTNLGDTLKVEVIQGGAKATFSVEPDFEVGEQGIPGDYRAWLIPTAAGTYTFHFTGSILGQKIDQSFTSSASTFNDVEDPATVEFPAKAPTTQQLSQRIDRELPRLATVAKANQIHDDAHSAHTLGIIGIAVGAVGVLVGLTALLWRRRT